ncbi:zinc finger protein 431-like [Pieris brassicae]|uniref:zinc finger protein 431-like n=1 Tax=Pieris brassicae TaxID=7116 RepID=UPI001E66098D|nr:zinc finger protein 431-like [Pieris brassicae]XP_045530472.1 zinc finger protein 431-like [Pieris brassicae]
MVEPAVSDVDPLGAFSYLSHYHYGQFPNTINPTYQFAVKPEEFYTLPPSSTSNNSNYVNTTPTAHIQSEKQPDTTVNFDIKPFLKTNGKVKKEKKSFVSQKITQEGYPFYGCAVCNISFPTLRELDSHVATHKGRTTSYDLRVKNALKKKRLKKEQKKLKKMKKETCLPDIDIKPEDGYIGNEKATEFGLNNNDVKNKSNPEELKPQEKSTESTNLEKIYKCFACQKQFILSYYLKLHVRSHTDEKPYTCEQCGQSFITASKLGRHNKRFHLSVQYQCRICYRKFYRFEILTRHFDKKHADDKLEGEPYDFNAILPYLKELEEQLREKQEMEKTKSKDDIWSNEWPSPIIENEKEDIKETKKEVEDKNLEIEVVKVPMDDVEIKEEIEDVDYNYDDAVNDNGITDDTNHDLNYNEANDNDRDDASVNNDDSDEDYFPSNTWLKPEEPLEITTNGVKCPVCDKSLSTASYMRVHMRTHTGERPFKCYICDMGFITASKMHRHVLTHPESLKDEVKSENDGNNEKDDGDKEKVKKAVKKLSKKINEKSKKYRKRPHACEYCHKRFLHLHTLQIHKKSHEGEEIKYRCHYCLLEVEDEENLKVHEGSHTGPKPYQCTVCDKLYKKRESMLYHRKNHKPEREFICDICTKSFNAQCKLQRHIISHSVDKYMLKYECPVCAHMFNTKYHVQMHLSTHQREGVIQEENRNEILAMVLQNARRIPRKGETHNLTDVIPSDERSRVCNICGEVFQHFYYLEEHLKSHGSKIAIENIDKEEEKKYICEVCNKAFKLHYYLKLHSFTHTKEKPFICQQCGKGFITRGKLKRHLETHTGLKKYQCHICCKFFTRPSYLRVHVRTIHGAQLVRLGLRT